MKTAILVLAVAILGNLGCGRPVADSCKFGTDCQAGEWCVSNWGTPPKTPAGNVCAQDCKSNSECETGCCSAIGDGVGNPSIGPGPGRACAPAELCR